MKNHVLEVKSLFEQAGLADEARKMQKYMRDLFPYYGVKSRPRTEILRKYFRENPIKEKQDQKRLIQLFYQEEKRELHYAALFLSEKYIKKQDEDYISFLEYLITTNSWWDSVDWVNKLVGIHFKRFPHLQKRYADKWIQRNNIWLQRIAIIHQLTYKDNTDWGLLQKMILQRMDSGEFFVNKAIGWALRQFAKFEPQEVIDFVSKNEHQLSGLSKREALKNVK